MDPTRNWYFSIDNERHGPVDEAMLNSFAQTGKLKPNDLVWHPELDAWRKARDVPEIHFEADALAKFPIDRGTFTAAKWTAGIIGLLTGIVGLLGYGILIAALSFRDARSPMEGILLGVDTIVLLLSVALAIQSTCLLLGFRWAKRVAGNLCFAMIIGSLTSSVILVMLPASYALHGFNALIAGGAIAVNFLINPLQPRK